jgi:SAM-dependent methyltransferase
MTGGEASGELWSRGVRDWVSFVEPHYQSLYNTVHDLVGIGKGTRLLDVGCGPGGAAVLAAARGARVTGLDAAPDSVEMAHERLPEGDFRIGDMESLPWPDDSFDAVTGFNSFPFAANPVAALKEARRVLAPRGKLGIVIFSRPEESQQTRIMAAIAALTPPQSPKGPSPFALSSPGLLASVLEEAGLKCVDRAEVPIALRYATAETACRAFMAGGGGARAVQHSGEERVQQAIRQALEGFRVERGEYRIENRFQFVIAE